MSYSFPSPKPNMMLFPGIVESVDLVWLTAESLQKSTESLPNRKYFSRDWCPSQEQERVSELECLLHATLQDVTCSVWYTFFFTQLASWISVSKDSEILITSKHLHCKQVACNHAYWWPWMSLTVSLHLLLPECHLRWQGDMRRGLLICWQGIQSGLC